MDVLSLVGIILAFVTIVGSSFLEGGYAGALLNGPVALIVIGGTLATTLLQTPVNVFKHGLGTLGRVSFPPRGDLSGGINRIVFRGMTARKEGPLGLKGIADAGPDPYAHKGLQLLADGAEPEVTRSILGVDLFTQESRDLQATRVFESMGGYVPAIGIIGTVMGLTHVMGNLVNPAQFGGDIAVTFVAAIHDVGSANLLLLPIGNKLKILVLRQSRYREMLLGDLLLIAEDKNPCSIELKLQGFTD